MRCVDWDTDGINDLLMTNVDSRVYLSFGSRGGIFADDSLLFMVNRGCTGMNLIASQATGKDMYFGYSDGTIQYINYERDGGVTSKMVKDVNGFTIDAGVDASVLALDITGDGISELLVDNSSGSVQAYTLKAIDTVFSVGNAASVGMALKLSAGTNISSSFGTGPDLPVVVYADENGILLRSNAVLRGDITGDGTVNINDLQQLGIHWGQLSSDWGWKNAVNLSVNTSEPQIINALDLQILGNFWGLNR